MSTSTLLKSSLSAIDANALISEFAKESGWIDPLAEGCEKIALWVNALRQVDTENPALPFLVEMQRASHDVAALLALSLYVPAAASMRTMAETVMYYSYFRHHPAELATLVLDPNFYVSKADVLEFHKQHTPSYKRAASAFGFPGALNDWYSRLSAIIHGQIPGAWGKGVALSDVKHDSAVLNEAVKKFSEGVRIIESLLFLTVGSELWSRIHHEAKRLLLKGMPTARRELLGLDGKL